MCEKVVLLMNRSYQNYVLGNGGRVNWARTRGELQSHDQNFIFLTSQKAQQWNHMTNTTANFGAVDWLLRTVWFPWRNFVNQTGKPNSRSSSEFLGQHFVLIN